MVWQIPYTLRRLTNMSDAKDQAVELADLQALFSLRWNADMRAIKMWQKEDPSRSLTWPDHADLVVWLLGALEVKESYGWVIETEASQTHTPYYWTGLTRLPFSKNPLDAVRFSRKEDASMVALGILKDTPTRVVEHCWS